MVFDRCGKLSKKLGVHLEDAVAVFELLKMPTNKSAKLFGKLGVHLEDAVDVFELLMKEMDTSSSSSKDTNTDMFELNAQRADLKARELELQADRAGFKAAKAKLEEDMLQLEAEKTQFRVAQIQLKAAQSQLEDAKPNLESAQTQLKEARGQLEIARKHLEAAKTQTDITNTRLAAAKQSLDAEDSETEEQERSKEHGISLAAVGLNYSDSSDDEMEVPPMDGAGIDAPAQAADPAEVVCQEEAQAPVDPLTAFHATSPTSQTDSVTLKMTPAAPVGFVTPDSPIHTEPPARGASSSAQQLSIDANSEPLTHPDPPNEDNTPLGTIVDFPPGTKLINGFVVPGTLKTFYGTKVPSRLLKRKCTTRPAAAKQSLDAEDSETEEQERSKEHGISLAAVGLNYSDSSDDEMEVPPMDGAGIDAPAQAADPAEVVCHFQEETHAPVDPLTAMVVFHAASPTSQTETEVILVPDESPTRDESVRKTAKESTMAKRRMWTRSMASTSKKPRPDYAEDAEDGEPRFKKARPTPSKAKKEATPTPSKAKKEARKKQERILKEKGLLRRRNRKLGSVLFRRIWTLTTTIT